MDLQELLQETVVTETKSVALGLHYGIMTHYYLC
jgi:hypothetical protein